jgi:hypothetical protein
MAAGSRVVQALEKTTGHARTFARNFSFLAVSLRGGFSALGGKAPGHDRNVDKKLEAKPKGSCFLVWCAFAVSASHN